MLRDSNRLQWTNERTNEKGYLRKAEGQKKQTRASKLNWKSIELQLTCYRTTQSNWFSLSLSVCFGVVVWNEKKKKKKKNNNWKLNITKQQILLIYRVTFVNNVHHTIHSWCCACWKSPQQHIDTHTYTHRDCLSIVCEFSFSNCDGYFCMWMQSECNQFSGVFLLVCFHLFALFSFFFFLSV